MDDFLLVMLSIIGLLAIYWALFGQWKYNKMIREAEEEARKKQGKAKEEEKSETGSGSDKRGA
ncbi:MAG: hypothetical protein KAI26_08325 [Nanoarchaeota archaeon]|nr:hypothetical protein [Nanoarchaeota archaeon]